LARVDWSGVHEITGMPSIEILIAFTAASLVLILVPGPNLVYIVTRSASQGWRAGAASALGVETGTLAHLGLAALGVSSLLAASPLAFAIVRYAGAAYLVWLAYRALRSASALALDSAVARQPLYRMYADGVLVNVLNPKVALFFLAFLPQFADPTVDHAAVQLLALGLTFALLTWMVFSAIGYFSGSLGNWLESRPGYANVLRWLTGGVLVGLGLRLAFSDRR
jgi:threonine/homoserine/homoserine lactone efflux protein